MLGSLTRSLSPANHGNVSLFNMLKRTDSRIVFPRQSTTGANCKWNSKTFTRRYSVSKRDPISMSKGRNSDDEAPAKKGMSKENWNRLKVSEQLRRDSKLSGRINSPTGAEGASRRARKQTHLSPRYNFDTSQKALQVSQQAGLHLEAVKKHITETLGLDFENWEQVQQAMTHYSYKGTALHNDSLSRLGEKALRFVLTSELQKECPDLSKSSWFLVSNVRFMTRFQFLAEYIDATLSLGSITKCDIRELPNEANKYDIGGRDRLQVRQAAIAKSVMALIAVIFKQKGEPATRDFIKQLFIEPYREGNGVFNAPALQPVQIPQTGRL